MTLSKQIKQLKSLIDEIGNCPVIQYTDRWNFDPNKDRYLSERPVREEVMLSDVLAAYEHKSSELFERFGSSASFREMVSVLKSGKCWKEEKVYEDTKKLFDELNPGWEEKNRREFRAFMSTMGGYAMPIRNVWNLVK